nr:hypothetical protein [Tanacetum cinerariifolium]
EASKGLVVETIFTSMADNGKRADFLLFIGRFAERDEVVNKAMIGSASGSKEITQGVRRSSHVGHLAKERLHKAKDINPSANLKTKQKQLKSGIVGCERATKGFEERERAAVEQLNEL